jgi:starch synthase
MHITHVTSEFSPFAKAGGLGDVIHGLSKQQVHDGHHVEIILPKYDIIDLSIFDSLEIFMADLWSYENGKEYHNTVYRAVFEGITIFLIDPDHNDYYFSRGKIYGAENDVERFLYFSRSAVEFLRLEKHTPNILHIHDWPVAVIAPIIHHLFPDLKAKIGNIVFNIHNIEHQGKIQPKQLTRIGLFGASFLNKDLMMDPGSDKLINLMKGAIHYSDKVVTVSPTYAKEITTSTYGYGLENTIKKFHDKLHGILNGIEQETWNPMTDKHLTETYPANSTFINDVARKKQINKTALFKELGMTVKISEPLIICVSRLASQKSPDLIIHAIKETLSKGGSFILLGNICEEPLEKKFHDLASTYNENKSLHMSFTFDEKLSHKLFAAADAIFIPSKFEPCGLTQLISMRYGTVPIARSTGGLKDTVIDITNPMATGFIFEELTNKAVEITLSKAFDTYKNNHTVWQKLMQNGMDREASWKSPARLYEKIYSESLKKRTVNSYNI